MNQLPETLHEAEARIYAREKLAIFADRDFFGSGVPTLHPEAGALWLRRAIKAIAQQHPLNMMWVIESRSRGLGRLRFGFAGIGN